MDVVFDAVERLSEKLRRRWPRTVLTVGLILWALVTATICWAVWFISGGPTAAVVVGVPPVALLIVVAARGIDRLVWPVWPLGVALPVFLAGMVAPQARTYDEPLDWLVPILIFVYAQIFLGTLATADLLYRRRAAAAAPMGAVGRRRILQTKVLVATLVMLGVSVLARDAGYDPDDRGEGVLYLGFGCLGLPMFVGVWLRLRALAGYAAGVLPGVYLLSLLVRSPDERWPSLLAHGWIVLTATWLWVRAARVPYWKWPVSRDGAT
jgi:hypothetical protein